MDVYMLVNQYADNGAIQCITGMAGSIWYVVGCGYVLKGAGLVSIFYIGGV